MAKLVDATDLKSVGLSHTGSSPVVRTKFPQKWTIEMKNENLPIEKLYQRNKCLVLDHGSVELLDIHAPKLGTSEIDAIPAVIARISHNGTPETRELEKDMKLSEYLWRHNHTTPFEMIETWWQVTLPIFVARQFVRHRTVTINEVSARYSILPDKWYIPKPEYIGITSKINKQGRIINGVKTKYMEDFAADLDYICNESYQLYQKAIRNGIPAEIARLSLHVNHYTTWVWKQDFHNLANFLTLRRAENAQFESRVYAEAKYRILKDNIPHLMEIFDNYPRLSILEEKEISK